MRSTSHKRLCIYKYTKNKFCADGVIKIVIVLCTSEPLPPPPTSLAFVCLGYYHEKDEKACGETRAVPQGSELTAAALVEAVCWINIFAADADYLFAAALFARSSSSKWFYSD